MSNHITEAVANKAAATSGVLAGASWLVDLELYLQLGATAAAILAGIAAAWYHFERARYYRGKNQVEEEE